MLIHIYWAGTCNLELYWGREDTGRVLPQKSRNARIVWRGTRRFSRTHLLKQVLATGKDPERAGPRPCSQAHGPNYDTTPGSWGGGAMINYKETPSFVVGRKDGGEGHDDLYQNTGVRGWGWEGLGIWKYLMETMTYISTLNRITKSPREYISTFKHINSISELYISVWLDGFLNWVAKQQCTWDN